MKASELRIGNWVTDEFGDKVQVFEINEIFATVYEPIPLTPEILEKCGFEKYKDNRLWRLNGFYLHQYIIPSTDYAFKCQDFVSSSICHLHQLQNLFYALTGEELNYQP